MDAKKGDQVQWLQLYVNKDRDITRKIVEHAETRGCKGLFITVDAPQLGRREKGILGTPWHSSPCSSTNHHTDMRSKFDDVGTDVQKTDGDAIDRSQGAARAM